MNDPTKRQLLLGGSVVALASTGWSRRASATLTVNEDRPDWHFCNKCRAMFYLSGNYRVCAAGDKHIPQGYKFRLPFGGQETRDAQSRWFCCKFCSVMFYDGLQQKGRCPANHGDTRDKGHVADRTFAYRLPHDVPATRTTQGQWRFCQKCYSMFYDGDANKGICEAGGGHSAQGFNFVLPYET